MTEETTTTVEAPQTESPQTGTPEKNKISATSMFDNSNSMSRGDKTGQVLEIPTDSPQAESEDTGEWWLNEDTKGTGPRPDWVDKKYGYNVMNQAMANNPAQKYIGELKNKLGTFADWKSPENYDFSEISDKNFRLDVNDTNYNNFIDMLRSHNVPQDFADKIVGFYKEEVTKNLVDVEKEMELLGSNPREQLDSLEKWAKSNFAPRASEWIFGNVKTAEDVSILKEIRASMIQTSIPTGVDTKIPIGTKETLQRDYMQNLEAIKQSPDLQIEWINKFKEFV